MHSQYVVLFQSSFGAPPLEATPILVDWLYKNEKHYPAVDLTVAAPAAAFTWDLSLQPIVQFTNQSIGSTSYMWDFDGIGSSTERDPSFTFPVPFGDSQVYAVSLTINGGGSPELTVIHLVTVANPISLSLDTLTIDQLDTLLTIDQLDNLPVQI